eukprot:TRINITY_DN12518_c0_g1_i1.p1 TRINITY_DN12518_c0_g1~~TRINITY_DN12518_c0_g1_i1.p1  ORF type:complete len:824 (+),score=181.74 TRINITY_DN12518_c0_g1_i1:171-2642(+)
MGGGCFKVHPAAVVDPEPLLAAQASGYVGTSPSAASNARYGALSGPLTPVTSAASASSHSVSTLEECLRAFRDCGSPPADVAGYFVHMWLPRAAPKARNGLLNLLRHSVGLILDKRLSEVEEVIKRRGEATNSDFERVAELVEEHLKLDEDMTASLQVAAAVASEVSTSLAVGAKLSGSSLSGSEFVLPAFDRLVLLFRRALLADSAGGGAVAGRMGRWRDMEADAGLPPMEKQLILLSGGAKGMLLSQLLVPEGSRPAQVVISRDSGVLSQAGKQLPANRAYVLSPYFESTTGTKVVQGHRVEGGEGHGPRKEFFVAVSEDSTRKASSALKQPPPLFTFHRGAGQHWFSAYASDLSGPTGEEQVERLRCFGKLIVLAVANHCKLSFTLPLLFFRLLLRPADAPECKPTLADVQTLDATLASSIKKTLKMRQAQFKALLSVSDLPPDASREEYVESQVAEFMCPQAMQEVRQGFWELANPQGSDTQNGHCYMASVLPSELRQIVCPTHATSGKINIRQTFEVVMEEELSSCQPFVKAFWSVVDGLTQEQQKRFLLFVTGVEAPPEPQTEQLTIQLPFSAFSKEEHEAMLERLPQAHTCSNCLELPSYHEALIETGAVRSSEEADLEKKLKKLLSDKLTLAINETVGYELDAVVCDDDNDMAPLASAGHWPAAGAATVPGATASAPLSIATSTLDEAPWAAPRLGSPWQTTGATATAAVPSSKFPPPLSLQGIHGGVSVLNLASPSTGTSREEELESLLESLSGRRHQEKHSDDHSIESLSARAHYEASKVSSSKSVSGTKARNVNTSVDTLLEELDEAMHDLT